MIALDATSGGSASTTAITVAHTCTGSNLYLIVDVFNQGDTSATDVTGVTYNGVAMTLIVSGANASDDAAYQWYLINPATGANNIVVTRADTTGTCFVKGTSYTGVKQSGQPDASAYKEQVTNTLVSSVTVVAENSWAHLGVYNPEGGAITASTNTTSRNNTPNYTMSADNNADITAGSYSMTVTRTSGSSEFMSVMSSFAPAVASTFIPRMMVF